MQDDTSSLDWRNWTFLGNTTYVSCGLESSNSSVSKGSVGCLNFDKIRGTLDPLGDSSFQNASTSLDRYSICPENLSETSRTNSTLPEDQIIMLRCQKMPKWYIICCSIFSFFNECLIYITVACSGS